MAENFWQLFLTINWIAVAVKATIVILSAFVAIAAARRSRASTRHGVYAALFIALLLLPVATRLAPATPLAVPVSAPAVADPAVAISPGAEVVVTEAPAVQRRASIDWMSVIRNVYVAGVALMLSILAAGVWRLRKWAMDAEVWIDGAQIATAVARDSGIRRAVLVVTSDEIAVPMTFGFRRQTIVMPASAKAWDEEAIRRAIRHELEHVRRDDWAMQLLARVTCALYWPHPLVWMAWRRFCLEAERVCDDAVVRSADASTYASQLVDLARKLARPARVPALAMASPSRLSERVHAILDPAQRRGPQSRAAVMLTAAIMAAVVVTFGSVRLVAAVTESVIDVPSATSDEDQPDAIEDIESYGDSIVKAAVNGNVGALDTLLITSGLGVNTTIPGDGTALLIAARAGQKNAVEWLLDRGADPNVPSPGDGNPLIAAAKENHVPIMTLLLARGARVDEVVPGDENALISAAAAGAHDAVKLLIARGANVNARVWGGREWRTPLMMARRGGHDDVMRTLMAAGARE